MSLQFRDYKKKIERKKYLNIDFFLEDGKSLAIIDEEEKSIALIKDSLKNKHKYTGDILFNKVDIKKDKHFYPFFLENTGFYPNFTAYQNLKNILALYQIKLSKTEVVNLLQDFDIKATDTYESLSLEAKEKFHILVTTLISRDVLFIDIHNSQLSQEDLEKLAVYIKDHINKQGKHIIVLANKLNAISELCDKVLVISDNQQVYFDDSHKLQVIKDLIVIETSELNEEYIYSNLQIDLKILDNKMIVRKNDLEDVLYFCVRENIDVISVKDFNENTDIAFEKVGN